MDAAEQEAARAKELTWLNASAKGFRSQFVSTRNTLVQALPLYEGGPTASRRWTIDEAIARIGLQADKVHDAYQRLIELDDDERHLTVTIPKALPLAIGPSLEDQYVSVNYTSTRFPGWEHGGTRPVQIHTLDDPFHRRSRERSLGIPVDPKADVQAPVSGHPHPGSADDQWEGRDFMPGGPPNSATATPSFVDRFRPPGRSAHQVTNIHWPTIGPTNRDAIIVAGPDGRQSSIAYQI